MDTQMKQRVFTGVVTHLEDTHGTVDQDVHFHISDVVGRPPQLGEKVLVKAVCDPSQTDSWTAQMVQTLNGQPFKSPPPLLPSMASNQKPGILGNKPHALLKSPKIPPLIPSLQPSAGLLQTPHHWPPPWAGQYEEFGPGGSRKRLSDGGTGRRGGRWEETGAWAGDGNNQKRRRWRGPSEEETPKKSNPAAPQTSLFLSCFSRNSSECEPLEMQRRYPHLHLPDSFLQLKISWAESHPPHKPLPLSGPCGFHVGSAQPETQTTPQNSTDPSFTVKVILLSLPTPEDLYGQCCGLAQENQGTQGGAVHPTALIKFLLSESKGELQLLGGRWSPQGDGQSPDKEPSTLIHTAVRCVKEQAGLDLQPCTQWYKMAEVQYLSEQLETVVFMLPDIWNLTHTEEELVTEKEADLSLQVHQDLVVHPSPGLHLSVLPLSSLLGQGNSKTKQSFEVGLMAELFSEMLQRDFGLQLYCFLSCIPVGRAASTRRGEECENSNVSKSERPNKRSINKDGKRKKSCGQKHDGGEESSDKEEDGLKTEEAKASEGRMFMEEGQSCDAADATMDIELAKDRPVGWSAVLPRRVLLSWVFFDRKLFGRFQEQEVQNLLLSLGLCLTPAQAQDLVRKVAVGGVVHYHKLCSCWEESDDLIPDLNMQGNRAILSSLPKEQGSMGCSTKSINTDVVSYKGATINIPVLLQSLEKGKTIQRTLEQRVADLQTRLAEAELGKVAREQELTQLAELQKEREDLSSHLVKTENLNSTYKKNLEENKGQLMVIIEQMQKMVKQTASLTGAKTKADMV
ncbi:cell cycle and apoptosis regulator protein 2 isoform X2 [Denticeps clupeoides]|uniref:DBC1/CARP1 catalytically inactive NUDIX hydrolase domain-containing protein n=1 Tax=Denticeps clupeoides TaxID=299321 RepID=A0AAY4EBV1_9TELE|nr:cell cycle and apoptosis regulator protein 2-like isoform X2 [Denticeps clupeoides]